MDGSSSYHHGSDRGRGAITCVEYTATWLDCWSYVHACLRSHNHCLYLPSLRLLPITTS
ncbi:hypothetical protein Tsubulata_007786 [Turnera subulata]|uniref:Uncharacterized protein n=1 Tax=Turnera subulata TaxID=218843 RepID=A0A9Q0JB23_9ROSI|nr:hypothetical protein Tsubulata_007786 [Turnera subulata]